MSFVNFYTNFSYILNTLVKNIGFNKNNKIFNYTYDFMQGKCFEFRFQGYGNILCTSVILMVMVALFQKKFLFTTEVTRNK